MKIHQSIEKYIANLKAGINDKALNKRMMKNFNYEEHLATFLVRKKHFGLLSKLITCLKKEYETNEKTKNLLTESLEYAIKKNSRPAITIFMEHLAIDYTYLRYKVDIPMGGRIYHYNILTYCYLYKNYEVLELLSKKVIANNIRFADNIHVFTYFLAHSANFIPVKKFIMLSERLPFAEHSYEQAIEYCFKINYRIPIIRNIKALQYLLTKGLNVNNIPCLIPRSITSYNLSSIQTIFSYHQFKINKGVDYLEEAFDQLVSDLMHNFNYGSITEKIASILLSEYQIITEKILLNQIKNRRFYGESITLDKLYSNIRLKYLIYTIMQHCCSPNSEFYPLYQQASSELKYNFFLYHEKVANTIKQTTKYKLHNDVVNEIVTFICSDYMHSKKNYADKQNNKCAIM